MAIGLKLMQRDIECLKFSRCFIVFHKHLVNIQILSNPEEVLLKANGRYVAMPPFFEDFQQWFQDRYGQPTPTFCKASLGGTR